MIMQTKIRVDWELIKKMRRQNMIRNNIRENSKRLEHAYKVGDKVLIVKVREQREKEPKLRKPIEGPYEITRVYRNGTVEILCGNYYEKINIRRLQPYKENKYSNALSTEDE